MVIRLILFFILLLQITGVHGLEFVYKNSEGKEIKLDVPEHMIWKSRFWKYDKSEGFRMQLYYPSLEPQIERMPFYIGHPSSNAPKEIKDEFNKKEELHRKSGDEINIKVIPYQQRLSEKQEAIYCSLDKNYNKADGANGLDKYTRDKPSSGSKDIILLPKIKDEVYCISCVENGNCRMFFYTKINGIRADVFYPEAKTEKNWKKVVDGVNELIKRYVVEN